jgi:hypothetical protein
VKAELSHRATLVPVPVAVRSKVHTALDRSNVVIADSNPSRGMDVRGVAIK